MSHTKGPWKFQWETEKQDWAIVTDASGGIVANVNTETGPDFVSAPATRKMPAAENAHLIAAAPDLLAALEALMVFNPEDELGIVTEDYWSPEYKAAMLLVRAALAKVRGEQ